MRKKEYLEKNLNLHHNSKSYVLEAIFKIFRCFKNTNKEELEETQKELKKLIIEIIKKKDSKENIKKIYVTFNTYEERQKMKEFKILIEKEYHYFKNADMSPHDINWENLNINKMNKFLRIVISYLLLVIFLFSYFLIILLISKVQVSYQDHFHLETDCSFIDYENNKELIYKEYINKKQNEKEKIFSYCYCDSDLNGKEILYNNIKFDPCGYYNKYKYYKKDFIYLISIILFVLNIFVEKIVHKLIKFQRLESKSNQINLNIIISTIIIIFTDIISVILINAKINKNKVMSFFIFGKYEDINPDWINDVAECIIYATNLNILFKLLSSFSYLILENKKFKKIFQKFNLFFLEDQVTHFYKFYKRYAPEKDYTSFSIFILSSLFEVSTLICCPNYNTLFVGFMMLECILSFNMFNNFYKFSHTFSLNENYFPIMYTFINIIIIIHFFMAIWWYSSEYFFIDFNGYLLPNDFSQDYINVDFIEHFISGEANIWEKIKAKMVMKRNLWFIIPMVIIIVYEIVRAIIYLKISQKEKKFEKSSFEFEDTFTRIKICELYGLLYFKTNIIYLKNNKNFADLINFIYEKYNWNKNVIFGKYIPDINEDDYVKVITLKKQLIEQNEENIDNENKKEVIGIYNFDSTFSPFLLDKYTIPFYSKLILSPYYS